MTHLEAAKLEIEPRCLAFGSGLLAITLCYFSEKHSNEFQL